VLSAPLTPSFHQRIVLTSSFHHPTLSFRVITVRDSIDEYSRTMSWRQCTVYASSSRTSVTTRFMSPIDGIPSITLLGTRSEGMHKHLDGWHTAAYFVEQMSTLHTKLHSIRSPILLWYAHTCHLVRCRMMLHYTWPHRILSPVMGDSTYHEYDVHHEIIDFYRAAITSFSTIKSIFVDKERPEWCVNR